jgi:integrase/ribosomal protein L32
LIQSAARAYNGSPITRGELCMAGKIRTLQKCPKCHQKFPTNLICRDCQTHPTRYFIDLWYRGDHIRIYSDPYGYPLDSLARTEQLLATIRHQIGAGKFDPKEYVAKEIKNLQFDNYAQAWLERIEQDDISRAYLKEIRRYVRSYLTPFFQLANIREIRDGHILDFKRQLPAHLSLKTVKNIMGALHKLLAEAKTRADIAVMPAFPKLGRRDPDTKFLTWDEQQLVLAHCREPYRTLFLLCMKHGCRLGEARALKWDCVNFKGGGLITIKASMDLGTWKPYTKEGDIRKLPLNSQVKAALQALPRRLHGEYVFVNQAGRPLSDTRMRMAWTEAARAAGIECNAYQGTRHSFCTQKILQGYSERFVMGASGHKTVAAFRRYGKLVTEALRDMIEDEPSVPTIRKPSVGENSGEK